MTNAEILQICKTSIGITGTYHDETILAYIEETKEFMRSAGVTEKQLDERKTVGAIVRGVADLWNLGAGDAKFSQYFRLRLVQLKREADNNV